MSFCVRIPSKRPDFKLQVLHKPYATLDDRLFGMAASMELTSHIHQESCQSGIF